MIGFSFNRIPLWGMDPLGGQGRGLGRSYDLTLNNTDKERAMVEEGRPMKKLL